MPAWSESFAVNQTSEASPALSAYGANGAFLVHLGKNNIDLYSTMYDGRWERGHRISKKSSFGTPALTHTNNGLVVMVCRKKGSNELLSSITMPGTNAKEWFDDIRTGLTSIRLPAVILHRKTFRFHMVYVKSDTGRIMHTIRDANGRWSEGHVIPDAILPHLESPALTCADRGDIHMVYTADNPYQDIHHLIYDYDDGKWSRDVTFSKYSSHQPF